MADVVFLFPINFVYVFCFCYVVVSDFRKLIIPNWAPVALISAFMLFAAVHLGWRAITAHLAVAAVVFAVTTAFFVAGWMGGGDVKLLAATALWMGPEHGALFTVLVALLGAVLASTLLLIKQHGELMGQSIWGFPFFRRLAELAQSGECPYGVAIGVAALIASPPMIGLG